MKFTSHAKNAARWIQISSRSSSRSTTVEKSADSSLKICPVSVTMVTTAFLVPVVAKNISTPENMDALLLVHL